MNDEDYQEIYQALEDILRQRSLDWIVEQVNETLSEGLLVSVQLKSQLSPSQSADDQLDLFGDFRSIRETAKQKFEKRSSVRKKGNTSYIKVSRYTPKERLEKLIDAIEYALIDGTRVKQKVSEFFTTSLMTRESAFIEFRSENEQERGSVLQLSQQHDQDVDLVRGLISNLRRRISENAN